MNEELKKENIGVKEEKQDGSVYRKVENKKNPTGITLKRFIFIVFAIVLIIGLIIGVRWRILYNIQVNYDNVNIKDNWHYYSDSDSTIMNVYRKGTIWKMNTKQKNGDGNLTFWKNTSTGEAYVFYEGDIKKYATNNGTMIPDMPSSGMNTKNESTRFLMAATPMLWLGTDEYDNMNCYVVEIDGYKEYIDKDTGLLLATFQDNKQIRSVEYEFGEVTDEDVAKPDLSQYEYIE